MAADGIPQSVRAQAVEQGGATYVAAGGGAYLVIPTPAGERVFVNSCPHRHLPLDRRGRLRFSGERRLLACPNHGAKFDLETGRCVSGPCFGKYLRRVLELER